MTGVVSRSGVEAMLAQEVAAIDPLNDAVRRLARLEAAGVRVRAASGRFIAIGDLRRLTEDDRAWIDDHQHSLRELLQVRPIEALAENPGPGRTFAVAPSQMGMWTGASHPDPAVLATVAATNQSVRVRCLGPLDPDAVQRAFRRLCLKHPALRTRLHRSAPEQSFHPVDEMRVAYRDVLGLDRRAMRKTLAEEEQTGFEFFGGKLARATLFRWGQDLRLFHLVCNHVIIDGWSAPILAQDFVSAYFAGPGDDTPWLDQGRLYFGYLAWEQSPRRQARQDLALQRWRRWLADAPSRLISARLDRPRSGEGEICDAVHMEGLDPALATWLRRAAPLLGVTSGEIIVSAILLLLAEESDCANPVALMLDSGRWRPEQMRLCSFLATPLPISTGIRRDDTLEAHVRAVAEMLRERRGEPLGWAALLEAYPHRPKANPDRLAAFTFNIVNFDVVGSVEAAGDRPARDAGNMQPRQDRRDQGEAQLRFVPMPAEYHGTASPGDFCLNVLIHRRPSCIWSYNSKLVGPGTLHRLTTRLGELIALICERPSTIVGEAVRLPALPRASNGEER